MTTTKLLAKIEANKELSKQLAKMSQYNSEQFLKDALQYIMPNDSNSNIIFVL